MLSDILKQQRIPTGNSAVIIKELAACDKKHMVIEKFAFCERGACAEKEDVLAVLFFAITEGRRGKRNLRAIPEGAPPMGTMTD